MAVSANPLTPQKHLSGLVSNPRSAAQLSPVKAYQQGLSLSSALKTDNTKTKVMLLAELERLTRHVSATRTFANQEDQQDAVDDICELFPSMKVEEVLNAFKQIRQGRFELYGNFTTNVLLDCIRAYELQNTVQFREEEHQNRKHEAQTACIDWGRLKRDLDAEGLLKTPRKVLDRTFIPYPNDKVDAKAAQQHEQQGEANGTQKEQQTHTTTQQT